MYVAKLVLRLGGFFLLLAACGGGSSSGVGSTTPPADAESTQAPAPSASGEPTDAGTQEASSVDPPDGTPTRVACTSSFGSGLAKHGRLDGYLVSIVPKSTSGCNADPDHLHLQVRANDAVYDIAVNLDALEATVDIGLPKIPWSEGWHSPLSLDYPADLGVHAAAFTPAARDARRAELEGALASTNHVSVWTTAYGPGGGHLVHRLASGSDGAIVTRPLAGKAHVIAFRFTNDSF